MTLAGKLHDFYVSLSIAQKLPRGIEVMNPYTDPKVMGYVDAFLERYYSDDKERVLVFGINPGRFGAGLTGIAFTDPVAMERYCGIANDLRKMRERSSEFVYRFIERWGGAEKFYAEFLITAVSPLGFIRGGKNCNYYDVPSLTKAVAPFVLESLRRQMHMGVSRASTIVFGSGENQKYLKRLNDEHRFFRRVYALDHPRFIMQYRRRRIDDYVERYVKVFSEALDVAHSS